MEVALELEDDLFFADLSKQISLLIMDDDDDEAPAARCPSVAFQDFSRARSFPTTPPPPSLYGQSCRRESKGTGVFIPRSPHPRRRHRQARINTRHHEKNTTARLVTSQASYSDSFDSMRSC